MTERRSRKMLAGVAMVVGSGLALPAIAQQDGGEFPKEWFHGNAEQRAKHAALAGKEAPPLHVDDWKNVDEDLMDVEDGFTWEDLEGKVVLLDYWATW